MNKLIIIFGFAIFLSATTQNVFAQEKVVIQSDPILDSIIDANIEYNKSNPGMSGFRVQIYFGSERKGAQNSRTKFLQLYPEAEAYLIYQQPYFKVRVGDYRTKFEAQAIYKKLILEFEQVFIVPDKINLPKL